jgi:hypothetical protein
MKSRLGGGRWKWLMCLALGTADAFHENVETTSLEDAAELGHELQHGGLESESESTDEWIASFERSFRAAAAERDAAEIAKPLKDRVADLDVEMKGLEAERGGDSAALSPRVDVPVLYINVDGHKGRGDFMEAQLAGEGAPSVTRIDGVLMTQADVTSGRYGDYEFPGGPSELGCTLSHMAAARHIVEHDLHMGLVVEDDVSFALSHRWPCKLTQMLPPPDQQTWTAIQLGFIDKIDGTNQLTSNAGLNRWYPQPGFVIDTGNAPGAFSYVLSRFGAERLMKATRNGTYLSKAKLGTAHGLVEDVMFRSMGATIFHIWPRLLFPQNSGRALGSTSQSRAAHVKCAVSTIKVAVKAWPKSLLAGSDQFIAQQAMCKAEGAHGGNIRDDDKCGPMNGGAVCDLQASAGPCCSPFGYCGNQPGHCDWLGLGYARNVGLTLTYRTYLEAHGISLSPPSLH